MHVVVRNARGERETAVRVRDPGATVGDLTAALGLDAPGLTVDGRYAAGDLSLVEAGIVEGAVLAPATPRGPTFAPAPAPPAHNLTVVAGRLAGTRLPLPTEGTAVVGRGDLADLRLPADTISECHAEVTVTASGHIRVTDLGSANGTWVDGEVAHRPVELAVGGHARLGALVLRLDGPPPDDRPGTVDRPVAGLVPFNRPPRPAPPPAPEPVPAPGPPEEQRDPPPFSVAALIAPIVMGGALVLIYGSLRFALFALLTPVMAVANWTSARRRARKAGDRSAAQHTADLARLRSDLAGLREAERSHRDRRLPDVAEVLRRATAPSRTLWERHHGSDDALQLRVGTGDVPWDPPVEAPRDGPSDTARTLIQEASPLRDAAVEADLRDGGVVGIVGDRDAALALARALLLQVVVHHGPADVGVAVCTDARGASAWDWTKWLPHVRDPAGGGRWLASDRDAADRLAEAALDSTAEARREHRLPSAGDAGPVRFLLVDAPDVLEGRGAPVRRVLAGEAGPVAGVVIATAEDRLPSSTTVVVDLTSELGDAEVRYPREGVRIPDVLTNGIEVEAARTAARALARFEDPELATSSVGLPDVVRLLPLLGLEDIDAGAVAERWRRNGPDPAPSAPIGVAAGGPVVLDLAADGPHGLIGGTTGSGKSELLRSLVAGLAARSSPDELVFVLVDYKGGSAFDVCAELPHTVGMVTDLDAHLGERALVSLEAELTYRERALRGAGAQDLPAYRRLGSPSGAIPRLAVVIDEFATMAAELPDFLGALVGIAQRGRSLGVHLLLATQRPSGAVNANIKANTNLRIALRVQDVADSADIIDRPDAAAIDRASPGRAYVRRGAGDVTLVQTALSTAAAAAGGPTVVVTPFPFAATDPPAPPVEAPEDAPSDLERLVSACQGAFAAAGLAVPRRPWLPMLPEHVAQDELTVDADDLELVAYGIADDPASQARRVVGWRPAAGHLAVTGMVGSGTTTTLRTLARALVRDRGPDRLHLYAIDFGGGALTELAALPHTGGVVTAADREGQHRLVRHLRAEVVRRRDLPAEERAAAPLLVMLVDDLPALLAEHDDLDGQELLDGLRRILAEGPGLGVAVAFTSDRPMAVPTRVTGALAQQLLLQQADPSDFGVIGVRVKDLPAFVPGRGLVSETQAVVQVAEPGALPKPRPGAVAGGPAPLEGLPADLPAESLPAPAVAGDIVSLPVGRADVDLAPADLLLHPGDHLTVAGPPRSGKSSALALLAGQFRYADPDVVLVAVCDRTRSPLYGHASLDACGSLPELADLLALAASNDRRWVFLVDDAPGVDDVDGALERIARTARPGLHLVAAGRSGDLRGAYGHWTRAVRQSRVGVLLQPDLATDGELLSVRLPRRLPLSFPAGRGFVVIGGEPAVVQLARPHRDPPRGSL